LQAINEKTVAACLYKLIFTKPQYSTKQTFLWGDMLTGKQILFIKKSPAGNALIKATLLADDSGKYFLSIANSNDVPHRQLRVSSRFY